MSGIATNQMAIRDQLVRGVCLTIDVLDNALGDIARKEIVKSIGGLISRGYVERIERGCYQLTDAGESSRHNNETLKSGPNRRHTAKARKAMPNTFRQRAWNAMRISVSFTVPDIVAVAKTENDKKAELNLQRYFHRLNAAGYLLQLSMRARGTRPGSNGFKRYRLINNTGDFAPVYQEKTGGMFDHNTREVVTCK